jgi:hypothetical protein
LVRIGYARTATVSGSNSSGIAERSRRGGELVSPTPKGASEPSEQRLGIGPSETGQEQRDAAKPKRHLGDASQRGVVEIGRVGSVDAVVAKIFVDGVVTGQAERDDELVIERRMLQVPPGDVVKFRARSRASFAGPVVHYSTLV